MSRDSPPSCVHHARQELTRPPSAVPPSNLVFLSPYHKAMLSVERKCGILDEFQVLLFLVDDDAAMRSRGAEGIDQTSRESSVTKAIV